MNLDNISQKILSKNDLKANELREIYKAKGLFVINLMSSPGSGKTTLLENLSTFENFSFSVIEGDLETNRDAERLKARGIKAYQITTGDACHLEALMVERGLIELQKQGNLGEYLMIENVGNLVCPASYDLGANVNIVLLSTPEGDDKILKYPTMFLCADIVMISKADLMEHFDFHIENIKSDLGKLNSRAKLLTIDKRAESLSEFVGLMRELKSQNYASKYHF